MDVEWMLMCAEEFMEHLCRDCPEVRFFPGDETDPPEEFCPYDNNPFDPKCPKSAELSEAVSILEGLL